MERDSKEFRKYLPNDYRRRTVKLITSGKVTLLDLNWSGGTKSTYTVRDIETGEPVSDTTKYEQCAPWNNPAEGQTLPIPVGAIVVQTGFFCGKVARAYIYVNSADMPRLLA